MPEFYVCYILEFSDGSARAVIYRYEGRTPDEGEPGKEGAG